MSLFTLRPTSALVAGVLLTIATQSYMSLAQSCTDWATVHMAEVNQALSKAECKQSEFIDGVPDLNGHTLDAVDVTFTPTTVAFRGEHRTVVDVKQLAIIDGEWAKQEFAGVVASKIPSDSCDDISAGAIGYSVADGALVADFDVHYQKNMCTKSTCFKGWGSWHGIPYPIYESCMAKTNLTGQSATLGVHTVLTPSLTVTPFGVANVTITAVPTTAVKEGPSELMKNIVGALTFGIGSKAMQDEYEHALGDFKASLSPEVKNVGFVKLPKARKQKVDVKFTPEQPYFQNGNGHLQFVVSRAAKAQPSTACSIKEAAIQADKFFQSCVSPQRQYVVQNNDSLWKIARGLYGDGQYYHTIEQLNASTQRHAEMLKAGQPLSVAPFYELAGKDAVLVSYGDSLWKIAGARLGNPLLYRELAKNNAQAIDDPQKLVTLVSLRTKIDASPKSTPSPTTKKGNPQSKTTPTRTSLKSPTQK
jgi:LysM repeat protein